MLKTLFNGRFGSRVDRTGKCWLWTAGRNDKGYGQVLFRGSIWLAHRAAYVLARGEIPEGLNVLHKCDNPACIRPSHLWLGTQAQNLADCKAKGRTAVGSRQGGSKLTEEQVLTIRTTDWGALSRATIGEKFNVSGPTISRVLLGTHWKHVHADL